MGGGASRGAAGSRRHGLPAPGRTRALRGLRLPEAEERLQRPVDLPFGSDGAALGQEEEAPLGRVRTAGDEDEQVRLSPLGDRAGDEAQLPRPRRLVRDEDDALEEGAAPLAVAEDLLDRAVDAAEGRES